MGLVEDERLARDVDTAQVVARVRLSEAEALCGEHHLRKGPPLLQP